MNWYLPLNLLPANRLQAYGCLEFFAGKGWVTRIMKSNNIATASFDIAYEIPGSDRDKPNAMDLLTQPGMASLLSIVSL